MSSAASSSETAYTNNRTLPPVTWALAKTQILNPDPKSTPNHNFNCPSCSNPMMIFPNHPWQVQHHMPYILICGHIICSSCLSNHLVIQSCCPVCDFNLLYETCDHMIQPYPLSSFRKDTIHATPHTPGERAGTEGEGSDVVDLKNLEVPRKCHACVWGPVCGMVAEWVRMLRGRKEQQQQRQQEKGKEKEKEKDDGNRKTVDVEVDAVLDMVRYAMVMLGGVDPRGGWDWSGAWIFQHENHSCALPANDRYVSGREFEDMFGPLLPYWIGDPIVAKQHIETWLEEWSVRWANEAGK